jgi:hypothetical protein
MGSMLRGNSLGVSPMEYAQARGFFIDPGVAWRTHSYDSLKTSRDCFHPPIKNPMNIGLSALAHPG